MQEEPEKAAGKRSRTRILIVEDENIVALDIRDTLISRGYQVVGCVASGEEAVTEVEKKRPDLVLMDIRLRGRMNGIEASRVIRRNFHVPSLYLTSYSDREILHQAKESGAIGYLLKPFEERELEAGIEIALHRWQVENRLRQALQKAHAPEGGAEEGGTTACPQLEIKALGRFEISLHGRPMARMEDFSQTQRELLALLLTSPALRISRENVQLVLWPESSPERARSSFDSLLLRFRKKLAELIRPLPVTDYLSLRRSILCLENCRVDVVEFACNHEKAKACLKSGDRDSAERALVSALECWQGPFMAGTCGSDFCFDFEGELDRLVSSSTTKLSRLLVEDGRIEEAIEIVNPALQADPINDALVRNVCVLLRKSPNPARVKKVLQHYERSLRQEGFSDSEIAEILDGI